MGWMVTFLYEFMKSGCALCSDPISLLSKSLADLSVEEQRTLEERLVYYSPRSGERKCRVCISKNSGGNAVATPSHLGSMHHTKQALRHHHNNQIEGETPYQNLRTSLIPACVTSAR